MVKLSFVHNRLYQIYRDKSKAIILQDFASILEEVVIYVEKLEERVAKLEKK